MNASADIELRLLLEAIYQRYHYDFRSYSLASIRRRVLRALPLLECETISRLQERVLHEPSVFAALLPHLTVQVSDLFRDPAYFRVLRESIVPVLRTYPSLKIWIAGCARGEEAYSFAILLHEEGLLDRTLIYATDIDRPSLERAEQGVYPVERVPEFAANHHASGGLRPLSDYYVSGYGAVRFDPMLRRQMVFSDHSLATDHVFAEVQLVSCRNVMIYFDPVLQERALGLFAGALCRKGFLGLGSKESLRGTSHAGRFVDHDRSTRWYQRVA